MSFVRGTLPLLAMVVIVGLGLAGSASASTPADLEGCASLRDSVTKPDGSILAVGISNGSCNGPFGGDVTVIQLRPDGSVDPAFAGGGVKIFKGSASSYANRPTLAGGGKVVIQLDDRLIRLNDDGSFDQTFDDDGVLVPGVNILDPTTRMTFFVLFEA